VTAFFGDLPTMAEASCGFEEEDLQSVGFLFDSCHARSTRKFDFGNGVEVNLRLIEGDPGHVQSGQYLWPAAHSAALWLLEHSSEYIASTTTLSDAAQSPCSSSSSSSKEQVAVVELGAGCGLAGLVASQLPFVSRCVLTDYDYGSLQLLRENAEALMNSKKSRQQDDSGLASANKETETDIVVERVAWGERPLPETISSCISGSSEQQQVVVLVIGTDLIYCKEVISPLFTTVAMLLGSSPSSFFVLVSSFAFGELVEAEVMRVTSELGLFERQLVPLNTSERKCRVQLFSLLQTIVE